MQAKWAASVCAVVLIFGLGAIGQESGNSNDPVLKTRPNDRLIEMTEILRLRSRGLRGLSGTGQPLFHLRRASKCHS